jgi:hypothetical protein
VLVLSLGLSLVLYHNTEYSGYNSIRLHESELRGPGVCWPSLNPQYKVPNLSQWWGRLHTLSKYPEIILSQRRVSPFPHSAHSTHTEYNHSSSFPSPVLPALHCLVFNSYRPLAASKSCTRVLQISNSILPCQLLNKSSSPS